MRRGSAKPWASEAARTICSAAFCVAVAALFLSNPRRARADEQGGSVTDSATLERASGAPNASSSTYATYGASRVRLKGVAVVRDLDAAQLASPSPLVSPVVLSGRVTDDAFDSIAAAPLTLGIAASDGNGIALATAAPETCDSRASRIVIESSSRLRLATDAAGHFCVRLHLAPGSYVAHVETQPTPLLDGSTRERVVVVGPPGANARRGVTLRFPAELVGVVVGEPAAVDLSASVRTSAGDEPAPGLRLRLVDASGRDVASATTGSDGHASFSVPGDRIDSPGRAKVVAVYDGDARLAPSETEVVLDRRVRVHLSVMGTLAGGEPPALATATAGDLVALRVRANVEGAPKAAPSDRDLLPTGVIEARIAGRVVGAGTLTRSVTTQGGPGPVASEAKLVVTLPNGSATGTGASIPIALRYVPDAPWLERPEDLVVLQPVRPPSPWGGIATGAMGVAALAWYVLSARIRWRVPLRMRRARAESAPSAGVHVIGGAAAPRGADSRPAWTGRVVDAHDGRAVAGAVLRVERPGFDAAAVLASAVCDADGRFVIVPVETRAGDRLVVSADLYVAERAPLPRPGELLVAVVLRRRALLDRFVAWSRRTGTTGRGRSSPEPTPSDVRADAGEGTELARWAEAVEQAAFGPAPVDAGVEAEVDRLAPRPNRVSEPDGAGRLR